MTKEEIEKNLPYIVRYYDLVHTVKPLLKDENDFDKVYEIISDHARKDYIASRSARQALQSNPVKPS